MTNPQTPITGPVPQPYYVHRPAAMSSTDHLLHIIISLLTCGLWLPIWLLLAIFTRGAGMDLVIPPGTDPRVAAAAQWRFDAARRASRRRVTLALGIPAVVILAVLVAVCCGGPPPSGTN